ISGLLSCGAIQYKTLPNICVGELWVHARNARLAILGNQKSSGESGSPMNSTFQRRRLFARCVTALLILTLAPLASSQTPVPKYPPTIVFMTDFGTVDDSVPICKGVMYSIMPEVRIVDLSHQVTPFSIRDGARFLLGATPYYPAGTIFNV